MVGYNTKINKNSIEEKKTKERKFQSSNKQGYQLK